MTTGQHIAALWGALSIGVVLGMILHGLFVMMDQ